MVWQCVSCAADSVGHCPNCAHRAYCSAACMERDVHECTIDVKLESLKGLKPTAESDTLRAFQRLGLNVIKWVFLSHATVDRRGELQLPPVFRWIDPYDRFELFTRLARDYRKAGSLLYEVLERNTREQPPFDVLRVSLHARFIEDEINAVLQLVAESSIIPGVPIAFSTEASKSRWQRFLLEQRILRPVPGVQESWLDLVERVGNFSITIRTRVTEENISERTIQKGIMEMAVRLVGAFVEFGTTLITLQDA